MHGRPYARASSTAIERVCATTAKPALAFGHIHSSVSREEATRLRTLGVPVLMGTATALLAMRHLLDWQPRRAGARAVSPALPPAHVLDAARMQARGHDPNVALPFAQALRLLELFGIPASPSAFTDEVDVTVAAAERLGFPVVLKTAAPDILHNTDAGGVVLGLRDRAAVADAHAHIAATCGKLVQVQAQAPTGTEVLLGMTIDAQLELMMTVGLGGVLTEILADAATFQPPVGAAAARGYLQRLCGFRLLQGYRARPAADLRALCLVIERFAVLCASIGSLFSAIDLNPVIAGPSGALAVDALFLPLGNL